MTVFRRPCPPPRHKYEEEEKTLSSQKQDFPCCGCSRMQSFQRSTSTPPPGFRWEPDTPCCAAQTETGLGAARRGAAQRPGKRSGRTGSPTRSVRDSKLLRRRRRRRSTEMKKRLKQQRFCAGFTDGSMAIAAAHRRTAAQRRFPVSRAYF